MSVMLAVPERSLDPPEPKIICKCSWCGDFICDGDAAARVGDDTYHEECFMDNAANLLLERFGAVLFYAGKGENDGGIY